MCSPCVAAFAALPGGRTDAYHSINIPSHQFAALSPIAQRATPSAPFPRPRNVGTPARCGVHVQLPPVAPTCRRCPPPVLSIGREEQREPVLAYLEAGVGGSVRSRHVDPGKGDFDVQHCLPFMTCPHADPNPQHAREVDSYGSPRRVAARCQCMRVAETRVSNTAQAVLA